MTHTRNVYGLIGFPLTHSFSKRYFTEKFAREGLNGYSYELFPLETIGQLPGLIGDVPGLSGLNVTIPYKESVIPYLDAMDEEAARIGAVNVIRLEEGFLTGYNSDVHGFEATLLPFIGFEPGKTSIRALVLGTGGASLAVVYTLQKWGIPFQLVSRHGGPGRITYRQIGKHTMDTHQLIIQATPLGTWPDVDKCPDLPYQYAGANHYFYDLVYNPAETLFLAKGKAAGARICNGLEMLHAQAARAWEIWQGNGE